MKRFMLFGFDAYYPSGGSADFVKDYDTLEEINDYIENLRNSPLNYDNPFYENWDIIDIKTKTSIDGYIVKKILENEKRKNEAIYLVKCLTFLNFPKDIMKLLYNACYTPYKKGEYKYLKNLKVYEIDPRASFK